MKTLRLFFVLIALALSQSCVYGQDDINDKIKQVESNLISTIQFKDETPKILEERMAYYKVHGLSLAVIQNYHILWAKGYGTADDSLKIPVTPQTLFQAASISKSINAVGVMKLVQEKKIDLYADINIYLKSWKFPYDSLAKGKKISTANLLSHTGGLTVHGFGGYEQGQPLPSVVQILNGQKPANSDPIRSMYQPGLKSEYSGGGITISQMIVMDVTQQPYADYMKKNVLQPLGMTSSTYAQPPVGVKPALLSTGYDSNGKAIPGKYHIYPEQAAAGLWTNPTDLAKYIIETQLAYEGKSAKVLDQQTTKLRLTPFRNADAALGVFITTTNVDSTKYFQHGGANEGFRCQYYGSLKDGNGIVVMVNSDNSEIMQEVVNSVAKVYNFKGLLLNTVKTLVKVSDSDLESYTGQYALKPDFIITLSRDGNQLYAQATGQPKFPIYPEAQNKFFPKNFLADLEVIKDATGKVTSVILYQNGHKNEAKKIK
jgi:CubicO group peptidase (beta-lactamase class C family)